MVLGDQIPDADDEQRPQDPRLGLGVTLLAAYFGAGVELIPGVEPTTASDTARETWTGFPVRFRNR
jgi:hypothetical protein